MTPLVVIGGGEHGRVVIESARGAGFEVLGFVDALPCEETPRRLGVKRLGDDAALASFPQAKVVLGVGIIGTGPERREAAARTAIPAGRWATVIDPHAIVSPTAQLGEGTVVLAGAIVGSGAKIGRHCVLNLGAVINHDVVLGDFVSIAPAAVLGGGARVDENSFVGMGAVVRDHIHVLHSTTIGMGCVVAKQFPPGSILTGIPAKPRMNK